MATISKHNGKASSVPAGMAISAAASMITTLVLSVTIAYLLNHEKITWEQAGYWIMGMLFFASFIGGKCAFATIKRQKIVVTFMTGIIYWVLLLCITALFFAGEFGAIWETAGVIGSGCGCAVLLTAPTTKRNRKKTKRFYR